MKNTIYTIVSFISIIILTSCDPHYCADYVIQNELEQDIDITLYTNSRYTYFVDSIVYLNIPSKNRERVELLCGMSGSPDGLDMGGYDSIHIILKDGRELKYTNQQMKNNIYDTENRDIWVEEYRKETKYRGGDYRFVFTIDESTIED